MREGPFSAGLDDGAGPQAPLLGACRTGAGPQPPPPPLSRSNGVRAKGPMPKSRQMKFPMEKLGSK
eukprot:CAMPEP_0197637366 /NCGR_PEP_ID=MMETSP1338-20131121/12617_1 /TAXON_ID=43686 ORGANISM="Pelagodinium beii, Strain RCC1491" /NCGR_SAMPLE_ID=MMETSP1338 /ASSEMBLY_ACC=CAM_ASM_000754 /LENGTH=65 /DNA_ID=CAMNT_0043209785 /DNA_START=148 /DNA_END=342 /DNA_ORIENTATION=+